MTGPYQSVSHVSGLEFFADLRLLGFLDNLHVRSFNGHIHIGEVFRLLITLTVGRNDSR